MSSSTKDLLRGTTSEIEKPNKLRSVRGLDDGRQLIGTMIISGLRPTVDGQSQVLEKGE